jgi:hypothetical protein
VQFGLVDLTLEMGCGLMNEENSRTVLHKSSNVYFLVKPDLRILSRHAATHVFTRSGRMNHMNESPFSSESGDFCDKPSELPDFCKKWGGRHYEKAEASGMRIGCPHFYPFDSIAIFCCRLQQTPFGVRQQLGAGLRARSDGERYRTARLGKGKTNELTYLWQR